MNLSLLCLTHLPLYVELEQVHDVRVPPILAGVLQMLLKVHDVLLHILLQSLSQHLRSSVCHLETVLHSSPATLHVL